MDRLPALIAAATAVVLAAGCSKPGDEPGSGESRSRVNAVARTESAPADPADLCDHMPAAARAPRLKLPALSGELGEAKGWRWINLWATWCAPCVEELPLLLEWERRLSAAGSTVELTLISADENDEVVAAFRAKHPGTPAGPRLANPDELGAWLEATGLPGASLPVHLIVDPDQKIRCLRGSAVGKGDFDAARALLAGG